MSFPGWPTSAVGATIGAMPARRGSTGPDARPEKLVPPRQRPALERIGLALRRRIPSPLRILLRRTLGRALCGLAEDRATATIRSAISNVLTPSPGKVSFGDLRRTSPIARDFGYSRGGPIDRYYIEHFLECHRSDVRGRVLEVGDSTYTNRFGDTRVTRADVLHVDTGAAATYAGDIADGEFLPGNSFDCVILTQTLHLVYDFRAALSTLHRVIAPGGVLLMTVPGISNVDTGRWGSSWHYSFTDASVKQMTAERFVGWDTELRSFGNVLSVIAFLHGLGSNELRTDERDVHQIEYSLIHAARLRKPLIR